MTGGLYIGDFLPHLSNSAGSEQRVYGFEPDTESLVAARGTIYESNLTNVFTMKAGVGSESGTGNFSSHASHEESEGLLVALDDVLPHERRLTLVHLDVEGYELDALK